MERSGQDGIERRDFVGGHLVAAGGTAVRDSRLARAPGAGPATGSPAAGADPDDPAPTDGGSYDLIIVGAGLSGLATAFFAVRANPGLSVLLIERQPLPGGSAARDGWLDIPAPTAGAYIIYPYDDALHLFYAGIGVRPDEYVVAPPFFSYFFDAGYGPAWTRRAMFPGTRRWVLDAFTKAGIDDLPFPDRVRADFHAASLLFRDWLLRDGSPTDPPDASDPAFDDLAFRSLHNYLTEDHRLDPLVAEFFDQYSSDCLGAATEDVNAHTGVGHLAAEFELRCAFPGGNSFLVRRTLKALIPESVPGYSDAAVIAARINAPALDRPESNVRCRTRATAQRVDPRGQGAVVRYVVDGRMHAASARSVVVATGMPAARALTSHLMDAEQRAAADTYLSVSTAVATVAVRQSAFLVRSGVGYDNYWYGGSRWQDFVVADWPSAGGEVARREDETRPNMLTVYGTALSPTGGTNWDAQMGDGEDKAPIRTTPFGAFEDSLREDLGRLFADDGFDFDRDVAAVRLFRLIDTMVVPRVGWLFGRPRVAGGRASRTEGPRARAGRALGPISFAGADLEGTPSVECAIAAGMRASAEVLAGRQRYR